MTDKNLLSGLPYVPFGRDLVKVPHVFVDGLRTPDTLLELSHWPGNRTPTPLKADVSTQSVIALLSKDEFHHYAQGAAAVTCDHYDIDGLLSVWAMASPSKALASRDTVENAAVSGDFDKWTTAPAVRTCLALDALERSLVVQRHLRRGSSTEQVTGQIFNTMLPKVEETIRSPGCVSDWNLEMQFVETSMSFLDHHPDRIESIPELDLAIVHPGKPLHTYAINSHTQMMNVVGADSLNRYWMNIRYESFVEMQSFRTPSRIFGNVLATRLNREETSGTWHCETPDTATPCLQMYGSERVPDSSSLEWNQFLSITLDFFQEAQADSSLRWSRSGDWIETSSVAPPSGRDR